MGHDFSKLAEELDKSNALGFLKTFPEQCRNALELGRRLEINDGRKISSIIVSGMGGSGIGGHVLRNLLKNEINIPIDVYHSYSLPKYADENTLVFAVSYSGNTEETIACMEEAQKRNCLVIALASGGKIRGMGKYEIALPKDAPQPRMAVPFLTLPMLPILEKLGLIENQENSYNEMLLLLEESRNEIDEIAKNVAIALKGKSPVIYAGDEMDSVAYRWVCELNENSKTLAHFQAIPEMNHNEINSEIFPGNAAFVFLRSGNENAKIAKRFEITKDILKDYGKQIEIFAKGNSLLARMYYAIFIDELASCYLALLNGKDPEPVPKIAYLKKRLAE